MGFLQFHRETTRRSLFGLGAERSRAVPAYSARLNVGMQPRELGEWTKFSIFLAGAALVIALVVHLRAPTRQAVHMRSAALHLPRVNEVLQGEPRFGKLKAVVYTGFDGCILIDGEVQTGQDARDARSLVNESMPPVAVAWQVKVLDTGAYYGAKSVPPDATTR